MSTIARGLVAAAIATGCSDGAVDRKAGADAGAGVADESDVYAENGIFLENGLKLTNGFDLGNGIKLTNGFNLANGIDLANGIKLTNGVNLIEPPPGSDLEKWIDADPTMRLRVLRYQVECALPTENQVTVIYRGERFTFTGLLALGASWLDGLMTTTDQERVSACLLARVNARGDHLRIVLVGPYPGLDSLSDEDRASFPTREATFVGNLFLDTTWAYVANLGCGSRACVADLERGVCDCGVVSFDLPGCVAEGDNPYDSSCNSWLDDIYWNPITTWVEQLPPGGACSDNVDCIDYNCGSGTCGGLGADCLGSVNCEVGCGWDRQCGGPGSQCGDSGDCIHDNCVDGYCGDFGAACDSGDQCFGHVCDDDGTCRACHANSECPAPLTCDYLSGRCLEEYP